MVEISKEMKETLKKIARKHGIAGINEDHKVFKAMAEAYEWGVQG